MKENKRPETRAEIKDFLAMKEKIMNADQKQRNVIYAELAELEAQKVALIREGIKQGIATGSRW